MNIRPRLRCLGSSDLRVTSVAMGCWPIAGMTSLNVTEAESRKTIDAAIDSGINFFDTAHCYGLDGISEKLLGQAVRPRRDELVLATKCGVHWDSDENKVTRGTAERLLRECDESLRRLKTEHIDLMYLHEPDPTIPIEDSAVAFQQMIQSGKVRYAALSNVSVSQAEAFHAICPIVAVQPPFNLIQQHIRADLVPWCIAKDVAIVCYWPLMKGLLAGKIRRDYEFDPDDKRRTYDIFRGQRFEKAQIILDRLDEIVVETGFTISQLVVAWTVAQPFITAALCGAKRDWQIVETAKSMELELSSSILNRINALVEPAY